MVEYILSVTSPPKKILSSLDLNSTCANIIQVRQTGSIGGRNQIVIPAQGIVDIRNAITEFLEEYGSDEG